MLTINYTLENRKRTLEGSQQTRALMSPEFQAEGREFQRGEGIHEKQKNFDTEEIRKRVQQ